MSIEDKSNKLKLKSENGEINTTKIDYIKIQCPDCGDIFSLNNNRKYYCKKCKRIFLESEIRARCGL